MTGHWPADRVGKKSHEFKCDRCPICYAHTHHMDSHKCDKLIALLYARRRSNPIRGKRLEQKGGRR